MCSRIETNTYRNGKFFANNLFLGERHGLGLLGQGVVVFGFHGLVGFAFLLRDGDDHHGRVGRNVVVGALFEAYVAAVDALAEAEEIEVGETFAPEFYAALHPHGVLHGFGRAGGEGEGGIAVGLDEVGEHLSTCGGLAAHGEGFGLDEVHFLNAHEQDVLGVGRLTKFTLIRVELHVGEGHHSVLKNVFLLCGREVGRLTLLIEEPAFAHVGGGDGGVELAVDALGGADRYVTVGEGAHVRGPVDDTGGDDRIGFFDLDTPHPVAFAHGGEGGLAHGCARGRGDAFGGCAGNGFVGGCDGIGPALLHEGDTGSETVDDGGADIAAVAALGAGGFEVDHGGVEVVVDALVDFFDCGKTKPLLLGFGLVVFGDHRHAVGLLVPLVGELEALGEGEVVEGANGLSLCAVVARNGVGVVALDRGEQGVAGTDLVVAVAPHHAGEAVDDGVVVEEGLAAEPVEARGEADGVGAAAVKAEHHGGIAEVTVTFGGGFQAREETHDTVDSGRGTLGHTAIEFRFLVFGDGVALRCGVEIGAAGEGEESEQAERQPAPLI